MFPRVLPALTYFLAVCIEQSSQTQDWVARHKWFASEIDC